MRIVHVLWGFKPWRGGGLVEYAEDTMALQHAGGHEVASFFAGRRDLSARPPYLKKWSDRGIGRYEIYNAPIVNLGAGGSFPESASLAEPFSERFFVEMLTDFRPDLVHFHELGGLPFSLIDVCSAHGVPCALTLHDYFTLCPTLFMFNRRNEICREVRGENCAECCTIASDGGLRDRFRTARMEGRSWLSYAPLAAEYLKFLVAAPRRAERAATFQRRFEENCRRFHKLDLVLAQSNRVREIYAGITGRRDIRVLHSAPSHIGAIRPKPAAVRGSGVINFATINGAIATFKGARLLLDAVAILKARGLERAYRLHVLGRVAPAFLPAFLAAGAVKLVGRYAVNRLDGLLEGYDVGIVPSVWEEVYGFTGVEFLAKGIPVIGNRTGGIVDYTIDGCSGWLNHSCGAEELADLMTRIIKDPAEISVRNQWILDNRDKLIADQTSHQELLLSYYHDAIAAKHAGHASSGAGAP